MWIWRRGVFEYADQSHSCLVASLRGRRRAAPVAAACQFRNGWCRSMKHRIEGRTASEPAIMSPKGSRLGLENWKRAVGWRTRIAELGRPTMRVHDLRHTYASLSRSAGADMKLLQVTMGHA